MNKVLIVEDHADIRRLIRMTLEFEQHQIFEAGNGERGLALAGAERPDVMLVDVMMPGAIDGLELCRRVTADPALAGTRIVILSACGTPADRERGAQAGAHAYLVKPFSPLQLTRVVEGLRKPEQAPS